jgi:hypothetical protein
MKTRHLLLAALLTGTVALSACNRDSDVDTTADRAPGALETPPTMTPEPTAPAAVVEVTDVQLGTEVGDDRGVTSPQTSFAADDDTIFAAVTTTSDSTSPATAALGVRWTYQDGQLIDERTETLNFTGRDITNFRVSNAEGWPMGSYNVEITLDGNVVENRQFTIQ